MTARRGGDLGYVTRTKDGDLAAAFMEESFVLVTGESKSGKTRSAYEAVRRLHPDRSLVMPAGAASLGTLLDAGLIPTAPVVWLDDLERYLGDDGVTEHVLERLTSGDPTAKIVATMRSSQLSRLALIRGWSADVAELVP